MKRYVDKKDVSKTSRVHALGDALPLDDVKTLPKCITPIY